ncbi:MAG: hypothetical protein WBD31_16160 [Rubripirellula sp.]
MFRIATATVFVVPIGWALLHADDPNPFGRSAGGYTYTPVPPGPSATAPHSSFGPSYQIVRDDDSGAVRRIPMVVETRPTPNGIQNLTLQNYDSESNEAGLLRTKYLQANDDAEREHIKAELTALIETQFDSMHIDQATSIQSMKERLQRVESLHEKRMDNRDAIIQRRIEDLLGMPDHLRWTPPVIADEPSRMQIPSTSRSPVLAEPNDRFQPYPDQRNGGQRLPSSQPPARYYDPHPPSNESWGNSPSLNNQLKPSLPRPAPPSPAPPSSPSLLAPALANAPVRSPIPDQPIEGADKRVFDVLRDLASRRTKLEATEKQLEQAMELRKKGAMPKSEVDAREAEVRGLRKQLEVDERELKWLKDEVELDITRLEPLLEGDRSNREKAETQREIDQLKRLLEVLKSNDSDVISY